MSKFTSLLLLIFATVFPICGYSYSQYPGYFSSYPPELEPVIEKIVALPEACQLLDRVCKNGPVSITQRIPRGNVRALWSSERRQIVLNPTRCISPGRQISSIIFELHNALSNRHFVDLIQQAITGRLSKENFVYQVEKMEYNNCVQASRLLNGGIQSGHFPTDADWTVYYTFDNHYLLQQLTGHSQWLADSYDQYNDFGAWQCYQGTLSQLNVLSPSDKKNLLYYLSIKNKLQSPHPEEVKKGIIQFQQEYNKLEMTCHASTWSENGPSPRKIQLFCMIFSQTQPFKKMAQIPLAYDAQGTIIPLCAQKIRLLQKIWL